MSSPITFAYNCFICVIPIQNVTKTKKSNSDLSVASKICIYCFLIFV